MPLTREELLLDDATVVGAAIQPAGGGLPRRIGLGDAYLARVAALGSLAHAWKFGGYVSAGFPEITIDDLVGTIDLQSIYASDYVPRLVEGPPGASSKGWAHSTYAYPVHRYGTTPVVGVGSPASVAFWGRNLVPGNTGVILSSTSNWGGPTPSGMMVYTEFGNCWAAIIWDGAGGTYYTYFAAPFVQDDTWHHYCVTYNGGTGVAWDFCFYIDGVLQAQAFGGTGLSSAAAGDAFCVGQTPAGLARLAAGDLCDFSYATKCYSAAEVLSLTDFPPFSAEWSLPSGAILRAAHPMGRTGIDGPYGGVRGTRLYVSTNAGVDYSEIEPSAEVNVSGPLLLRADLAATGWLADAGGTFGMAADLDAPEAIIVRELAGQVAAAQEVTGALDQVTVEGTLELVTP